MANNWQLTLHTMVGSVLFGKCSSVHIVWIAVCQMFMHSRRERRGYIVIDVSRIAQQGLSSIGQYTGILVIVW